MKMTFLCLLWMSNWKTLPIKKLVILWVLIHIIHVLVISLLFDYQVYVKWPHLCFLVIFDRWIICPWHPRAIKWSAFRSFGKWCLGESPYVKGVIRIFLRNLFLLISYICTFWDWLGGLCACVCRNQKESLW